MIKVEVNKKVMEIWAWAYFFVLFITTFIVAMVDAVPRKGGGHRVPWDDVWPWLVVWLAPFALAAVGALIREALAMEPPIKIKRVPRAAHPERQALAEKYERGEL